MQKILVIGGAGFIGARIARRAAQAGAQVAVAHRPNGDVRRLTTPHIERYGLDLLDAAATAALLARLRPDWVVQAAGVADWRREPTLTVPMLHAHTLVTAHVLEAVRRVGTERLVLFGSAGEYGDVPNPAREEGPTQPGDPYSVSKLAATELARTYHRAFGVACTVVRPFGVYGPGEAAGRLFPSLFAQSSGPLPCTAGEQVRDFVYVDDVAEGVLRIAATPATVGQVVNLGTGVGTRVRDAVEHAVGITGRPIAPQFGALPYRIGEPMQLVASVERLRALCNWSPSTTLDEGLRRMWRTFSAMEPHAAT